MVKLDSKSLRIVGWGFWYTVCRGWPLWFVPLSSHLNIPEVIPGCVGGPPSPGCSVTPTLSNTYVLGGRWRPFSKPPAGESQRIKPKRPARDPYDQVGPGQAHRVFRTNQSVEDPLLRPLLFSSFFIFSASPANTCMTIFLQAIHCEASGTAIAGALWGPRGEWVSWRWYFSRVKRDSYGTSVSHGWKITDETFDRSLNVR